MAKNKSGKSNKNSNEIKSASRLSGGWKFFVGLVMALAIVCILVLGGEIANRVWPDVFVAEEAPVVQEI